ncbi:hypothetical protein ON003_00090 [Janibacter hoylei]|uniref:hypothetical protein n=1 Tax=Janibacter hoylei TaxID=364298 RepID=UPI00223858CC|nr:hypothetical protein [Janibacter hoylei]MCW4600183.1 hypothetical protein [Janibacter hoylei]
MAERQHAEPVIDLFAEQIGGAMRHNPTGEEIAWEQFAAALPEFWDALKVFTRERDWDGLDRTVEQLAKDVSTLRQS